MQEQLITHATAVIAFEKGFNWRCYACYMNGKIEYNYAFEAQVDDKAATIIDILEDETCEDVSKSCPAAPTQSLLQKWLRDTHAIHISVFYNQYEFWAEIMQGGGESISLRNKLSEPGKNPTDNYEDVMEIALKRALLLINAYTK